jgi:hypothetical protein
LINKVSLFGKKNDEKPDSDNMKIENIENKQSDIQKSNNFNDENTHKSRKTNDIQDNNDNSEWKSFLTSRPEILVPCKFYVETDKKKEYFYGYVADHGITCTNEPYKLVVLRKKYNNLYYKEMKDCFSIVNCPNNFPDCEHCKRNK